MTGDGLAVNDDAHPNGERLHLYDAAEGFIGDRVRTATLTDHPFLFDLSCKCQQRCQFRLHLQKCRISQTLSAVMTADPFNFALGLYPVRSSHARGCVVDTAICDRWSSCWRLYFLSGHDLKNMVHHEPTLNNIYSISNFFKHIQGAISIHIGNAAVYSS